MILIDRAKNQPLVGSIVAAAAKGSHVHDMQSSFHCTDIYILY